MAIYSIRTKNLGYSESYINILVELETISVYNDFVEDCFGHSLESIDFKKFELLSDASLKTPLQCNLDETNALIKKHLSQLLKGYILFGDNKGIINKLN